MTRDDTIESGQFIGNLSFKRRSAKGASEVRESLRLGLRPARAARALRPRREPLVRGHGAEEAELLQGAQRPPLPRLI